MNKLLRKSLLLFVAMITMQTATAHDVEINGVYYNLNHNEKTAEVTFKGNTFSQYKDEYKGHVIIPSRIMASSAVSGIGFYTVTSIGDNAFNDCSELTDISIMVDTLYKKPGNTISVNCNLKVIGKFAFEGCTGLTFIKIPFSINRIGESAFKDCTELTAVYITDLMRWCNINFNNAESNPTFYAKHLHLDGEEIRDLIIPEQISGISHHFVNCEGIISVKFNQIIKKLDNSFNGCTGLKSIEIPNCVESLHSAFNGCTNLEDICSLPEGVVSNSFNKCNLSGKVVFSGLKYIENSFNYTNISYVELPNSVQVIHDSFHSCKLLETFIVPSSVTEFYGDNLLTGLNSLKKLVLLTSIVNYQNLHYLYSDVTTVYTICRPKTVELIQRETDCKVVPILTIENIANSDYFISFKMNIPEGISIGDVTIDKQVIKCIDDYYYFNPLEGNISNSYRAFIDFYYNGKKYQASTIFWIRELGPTVSLINVTQRTISLKISDINEEYDPYGFFIPPTNKRGVELYMNGQGNVEYIADENGLVEIGGLAPNTGYNISVFNVYGGRKFYGTGIDVYTTKINIKLMSVTQTTLDLGIETYIDEGFEEMGVVYDNVEYKSKKDGTVKVTGLVPGQENVVRPYAIYDGVKYFGDTKRFKTKDITLEIDKINSGATCLELKGSCDCGDATVIESGFSIPYNQTGDILHLIGLNPDSRIKVTYYAILGEEGYKKEYTTYFTTKGLEFLTLKAKATSNTKAIICAETNVCDEETGTGFEWRRIDAPDLVPSEEVYCAVHDGVMEGMLNNLSPNTYYKYRPFYKSAKGNMYYGEWIGFGTADAYVYFTPTVHTYASATVNNNSVTLGGYALGGSDDVVEQGFEYWVDNTTTRAEGDVMKIQVTGQRMSVTLTDLQYGTTYKYRAYVKTVTETTYGEEQSFTTEENPNGMVENIVINKVDMNAPVYNLQGIRMRDANNLPSGIYIRRGKKFIVR